MTISMRSLAGLCDFQRVYEFTQMFAADAFHVVDLPHRLCTPSAQQPGNVVLWEDKQGHLRASDRIFLGVDPLGQPEVYRQHSPITYATRVTTPTLILHGEQDEAVRVAQAYAFYRALQERQVPFECVIYPRAGHGPRSERICWIWRNGRTGDSPSMYKRLAEQGKHPLHSSLWGWGLGDEANDDTGRTHSSSGCCR